MSFNPKEPRIPAGQGGGGRWGGGGGSSKSSTPARSSDATKAQADPKSAAMYDKLQGLPPAERAKYLQGLPSGDLELLTRAVYGTRTSDPKVVQARLAVAQAMGKRGLDIKKYGALGSGPQSKAAPGRKVSPAQAAAVSHVQARKAAAAKPAAKSAPLPTQGGNFRARAI